MPPETEVDMADLDTPLDPRGDEGTPREKRVRRELAALRKRFDAQHEELSRAAARVRVGAGIGRAETLHRFKHSQSIGRKIKQMELRFDHVALDRIEKGIRAVRKAAAALAVLEYPDDLPWGEHERSIFRWAMRGPIAPKR